MYYGIPYVFFIQQTGIDQAPRVLGDRLEITVQNAGYAL